MFRSATFKLTMWYLGIVMAISLIFSVALYNMATDELGRGLRGETQRISRQFPVFRDDPLLKPGADYDSGAHRIWWRLVGFNVVVLIGAGWASYWLAKRTLEPIEEAHEQQKRFTADVSHELRTPLTALKMESEVALMNDKNGKQELRRALVTGEISPRKALVMAAVLGLLGFIILAVHTNWLTVAVGLVGFIDYIVFYGLSKRRSWMGTLVGSISGAAPVVGGYTAVTGRLDGAALILFLILTFWQMPHFYAIALRCLKDYKAAGIPVLPAVRGERAAKLQMIAYMLAFLAAVLALGLAGYAGVFYTVIMGALSLGWLAVALRCWRAPDTKRWATKVFLYSLILLPAFLVTVLIDALLAG